MCDETQKLREPNPRRRFETADVEKTQVPMNERDFKLSQGYGEAARPMTDDEIVGEFFKYHAPNESTIPKHAAINQAAKNFAEIIMANCPRGGDRTLAILQIRAARMMANAAVALNGLTLY